MISNRDLWISIVQDLKIYIAWKKHFLILRRRKFGVKSHDKRSNVQSKNIFDTLF